jgi:Zn-dependent protease/CBS domain-containing protein
MKNAVKIGSVAQIGIFLHWTFLLLLAGIFAFYLIRGDSVSAALVGVTLVLAVFACVVLHELGHALTARHFDVPTRDITLYPIGGVARLQRIPEEPMKEFWIAIAGPAVNVVIAAVLFGILLVTGGSFMPRSLLLNPGENFVATLMWLNVVLVGFNLLPAFPMDGGRVLRALLAMRIDYARATEIAANIGQGMAILFGLLGLIGFNPILLFIALFVYIGAQQEAQQAMMRALTQGIPVRQAMMTRFRTLTPGDTLSVAIDELLAGAEQDFPVVEGGRIVGVLQRRQLMKALAEHGRETRVGDVLEGDCFTVEDTAMLDAAFAKMKASNCSTVPVVRGGRLVGLLTLENVGELMMIVSALRRTGARSDLKSVLSS